MLKLTWILAIACLPILSFGQAEKRNNIYFQFAGNGLFLSLNYERNLSKVDNLYAHAGLGVYGIYPTFVTVPIGLNYLINIKDNRRFVDVGLGVTYCEHPIDIGLAGKGSKKTYDFNDKINFIPSVWFRTHSKKEIVFKVGISPIINTSGVIPFFGIAIGKRF